MFHKYNAIELEPELFIFYEACDAVLAVLDAKDALLYYNTSLTEENNKDTVTIHGWGVHHGKMVQEIFVVAYIERIVVFFFFDTFVYPKQSMILETYFSDFFYYYYFFLLPIISF